MGIFHTFVYQPLYNTLIFLYNNVSGADFGIAIIMLTIIIRTILIPLYRTQIQSQQKLQKLQPEIKKIQKKYKDDKEQQTKAMMELYRENKTNPFSGCLPLIVQIIFLIAIYRILITISGSGLVADSSELYGFVKNPGEINQLFISLVDLTKPNIIIAVLAALAQYFQTKMLLAKIPPKAKEGNEEGPDMAQIMNKQMLYLGPILTLMIGVQFPAGLSLYWLTSTAFMLVQQVVLERSEKKAS
ncbi:MAG TPA: YidC/Oxa1 family membrane protein insertase [Candidatus Moranbacteria bacterium]|nr:YidC/Oxa1 family membrane protein insertase [Candidatus Moranbacteria bacterium]